VRQRQLTSIDVTPGLWRALQQNETAEPSFWRVSAWRKRKMVAGARAGGVVWSWRVRLVELLAMLLLVGACGSSALAHSSRPDPAAAHAHVTKDVAGRYARGLAKAAWKELQLLPAPQAIADIHANLQAFADMTGCSIVATAPRRFSKAERADFVAAVFRSVIVAVKCP
jgi:hypothetical protein